MKKLILLLLMTLPMIVAAQPRSQEQMYKDDIALNKWIDSQAPKPVEITAPIATPGESRYVAPIEINYVSYTRQPIRRQVAQPIYISSSSTDLYPNLRIINITATQGTNTRILRATQYKYSVGDTKYINTSLFTP